MAETANVTLPNGQSVTVTGETREDVIAEVTRLERESTRADVGHAAARGAAQTGLGLLPALVQLTGQGLAAGGAAVRSIPIPGSEHNIGFQEAFQEEQQQLPASALIGQQIPDIDRVTGEIKGAAQAGSNLLQGQPPRLRENVAEQIQAERTNQTLREQLAPFQTALGDVLGQAAALGTARFAGAGKGVTAPLLRPNPAAKRGLKNLLSRTTIGMREKVARAGETGIEAAILETINGGDPLEIAGMAAGGQLVGSFLTPSLNEMFVGKGMAGKGAGLLKFAAWSAALGAGIQAFKELTPGGRDRILESSESAIKKVAFGMLLGVGTGAMGAGRLKGSEFAKDAPRLAEAINGFQRGVGIGMLQKLFSEDTPEIQRQRAESALQFVQGNIGLFEDKADELMTDDPQKFIQGVEEVRKEHAQSINRESR